MTRETVLLEEIYAEFINNGQFPKRDYFRNSHHQDLDILDSLETKGTFNNRDGLYAIPVTKLPSIKYWESEKGLPNRILPVLKEFRLENMEKDRTVGEIEQALGGTPGITSKDIQRAIYYLQEACFFESYQGGPNNGGYKTVRPREEVLRYPTIEKRIESLKGQRKAASPLAFLGLQKPIQPKGPSLCSPNEAWSEIQKEYDYSKSRFARQINFLPRFKREIVIRDVAQAYSCLKSGFYKPAAILAGGAIEELLRLYLKHHTFPTKSKTFENYIDDCEQHKLLRSGIAHLTHAVRNFRNFAHLAKENSRKRSISKSIATGAVSAVFTIVGNFEKPAPEKKKAKATKGPGRILRFKIKKHGGGNG